MDRVDLSDIAPRLSFAKPSGFSPLIAANFTIDGSALLVCYLWMPRTLEHAGGITSYGLERDIEADESSQHFGLIKFPADINSDYPEVTQRVPAEGVIISESSHIFEAVGISE